MNHWGIDVSNHQREFNFSAAKSEGFTWATHKVTEGTGYKDPFWPRARREMQQHFPGRWGGYVFCRTNTDPNREADFFMEHAGGTDFPVQVDYEDTTNGGNLDDLLRRCRAYTDRGYKLLPVYVPRWFWSGHMGSPDLSGLPVEIWNSHYVTGTGFASTLYGNHSQLPQAWADMGGKRVSILQFTEKALVAGQLIDANVFRGSDAELAAVFGGATTSGGTVADTPQLVLDQLAGPGMKGWDQLGNRSLVDALAIVLTQLIGKNPHTFDGWEQLGNRTLVDAVAQILRNQVAIAERLEALEKGKNDDVR